MGLLFLLILLFGVMYAFTIRPQQRRAREHQALIAAVEVGDEVMTTAGIFGLVTAIEGDVISMEISPGVVMRVARAAIGRRINVEADEYGTDDSLDDVDQDHESPLTHEQPHTPAPSPPPPSTPPAPPPVTPPPTTPGAGSGTGEPG